MKTLKLKPINNKAPDRKRFSLSSAAYSILSCAVPIFAFLLTDVYSDSKKDTHQENKKRASIENPFGTQTTDNEFGFNNSEQVPAIIKPEESTQAVVSKNDHTTNQDTKISDASTNAEGAQEENAGERKNLDELTTVLNVSDADIEALIKTFSKLTGRNYIVDNAVKGKITIHLPTAITVSEALKVFDSILLLKGFATVPIGENIWKVIIAKDAKQTTIPLSGAKNTTDESLVTEIIKSTHVGSEEIQKLVSQFISKDGYSQAISGTNLLILVDAASNINRIKNLLKEIDIPPLDQDITIITIHHATATDISEKINSILGKSDDAKSAETNPLAAQFGLNLRRANNLAQNAGQNTTDQTGSASRTTSMKIIPDERTNSLIVVADEYTTLKIRALVEQLDSEIDKSTGRFWVYRLEHAKAEELSEVLGNLISGSGGSPSSKSSSGSSLSRSQSGQSNSSNSNSSDLSSGQSGRRKSSGISRNQSQSGIPGLITDSSKVAFEDEISVAADPSTNSLIVNANKSDYDKLCQVIKELDVKRRQVLVEATILEVSLSDQESLGLELQGTAATRDAGFITQTNFGGLTNLLSNPAALTDLTIAAASTGSLTLPGGLTIPSQAALISAVSQHSNVNVLSAPTILSTDNQEAEIIVGENVPFVTSTSTNQTNLGNTFNQIQRQDVGITLKITPQLGTGDFLTLQIFVEISSVVDSTRNAANGPTTTVRTTDTVVAVKNGQMIVTGGLIQDKNDSLKRGIPFLQDVPFVGTLFRKNSDSNNRTNLLIFLTPKIIQDQYDARDISKNRAGTLSEAIKKADSYPSRDEVLKSPALDEVLENGSEEKIKENIPLSSNLEGASKIARGPSKSEIKSGVNTNGEYDFTIQESNRTSLKNTEETESLYLVFQELSDNNAKTLAYKIPANEFSTSTFKTGEQFQLHGTTLVCLGSYNTEDEANSVHNQIKEWSSLNDSSKEEFAKNGWEFLK